MQNLEKTIKDLKGENFDEEMLTLELHARYKISQDSAVNELYTELEKARAEYDQALASNDEKAVKASVKKITDLQAQLSNLEIEDSSVRNFLDSYIEMCNDYLGENKLKVDIEVNRDGLYDSLAIAVRNFGNGERVSAADILNFTPGSDTLSGGGSDYVKRQTKEAGYNALKTAADEAGISMQALTDTLIAFGLVEGEITQKAVSFTALSESFQNASAQLDNVQAAYKSVQSVLSDYNETGVLTIDHLQTLLSLGDEYLLSMVDENGQLQLNENAYKRLALAKLDKIKADMLDNAIGNLNALENEAAAAEYLKTKTDEAAESKYNLYLATLQEKQAQGGDVAKAANQIDSEVQRMLALFGQTAAGIETNTGLSLGGAQATNAYREALESEKNALEQTKTALENKKQALEDMKAAYEEDKQSIQSLIDLTMEMQKKQYETQKEQLENEKEAIREKVGYGKVLCGLSGGVDSSVAAVMLSKAVGNQLADHLSVDGFQLYSKGGNKIDLRNSLCHTQAQKHKLFHLILLLQNRPLTFCEIAYYIGRKLSWIFVSHMIQQGRGSQAESGVLCACPVSYIVTAGESRPGII